MSGWGESNNIEFKKTGRRYRVRVGPRTGKVGEEVARLSWGGVILEFEDGERITYALGDVWIEDEVSSLRESLAEARRVRGGLYEYRGCFIERRDERAEVYPGDDGFGKWEVSRNDERWLSYHQTLTDAITAVDSVLEGKAEK